MSWKIRRVLRNLIGIIFAGMVWDTLKVIFKPMIAGAITAYPIFIAAIKSLVPGINWADAAISAILVTLGIFIPLTLVIVMLRNQQIAVGTTIPIQQPEPAWRKTLNDLAGFLDEGNQIRNSAPLRGATIVEDSTWTQEAYNWVIRTKEFLERRTTPLARTVFLSNVGMGSRAYPSILQSAQDGMLVLTHRLENLEKIIAQPEVYL